MMLGRIFDPRDVGPALDRRAGARRTAGGHVSVRPGARHKRLLARPDAPRPVRPPKWLLDFALCSTIEHLRKRGYEGLSLNFAAIRSPLFGEKGDGAVQRAERWMLKKASSFAQIESLWRFNAKYDPEWLPRYVVFDQAEHLVPAGDGHPPGRVAVGDPRDRPPSWPRGPRSACWPPSRRPPTCWPGSVRTDPTGGVTSHRGPREGAWQLDEVDDWATDFDVLDAGYVADPFAVWDGLRRTARSPTPTAGGAPGSRPATTTWWQSPMTSTTSAR